MRLAFIGVNGVRRCSRTACGQPAAATLTYIYAESLAVLGPLSTAVEPHSYDLCREHSQRLTAPRGWEVVRLEIADPCLARTPTDDLEALAHAVRVATSRTEPAAPGHGLVDQLRAQGHVVRQDGEAAHAASRPHAPAGTASRRSHLRAVPDLQELTEDLPTGG